MGRQGRRGKGRRQGRSCEGGRRARLSWRLALGRQQLGHLLLLLLLLLLRLLRLCEGCEEVLYEGRGRGAGDEAQAIGQEGLALFGGGRGGCSTGGGGTLALLPAALAAGGCRCSASGGAFSGGRRVAH